MSAAKALTSQPKLAEDIAALGPWFQNLNLDGIQTAPDHFLGDYPAAKWHRFASVVPEDLSGKSVLEIGCNAGYYCLEMKRRGAERVVGADSDPRFLAQARLAADVRGEDIEYRELSVYDIAALGERFDLVLFMGVFYHLRHPLLALDLIHANVAKDLFLFQSMLRGSDEIEPVGVNYPFTEEDLFDRPGYPKMHFIEHRYADDPTNWWAPNKACVEAMLRSSGFNILANPESDVYLCRKADAPDDWGGPRDVYPRSKEIGLG